MYIDNDKPQLLWLQTAIYHMGLDVKSESHPVMYKHVHVQHVQMLPYS